MMMMMMMMIMIMVSIQPDLLQTPIRYIDFKSPRLRYRVHVLDKIHTNLSACVTDTLCLNVNCAPI